MSFAVERQLTNSFLPDTTPQANGGIGRVAAGYFLDTHLIYWWMTADVRLCKATQGLVARSEIIVSTASVWEITESTE